MKTVQFELSDISSLFQQGLRGNAVSFALLSRRLVSKLKKVDQSAAEELAGLLAGDSVTRATVQPVDMDSRKGLLKEDTKILLDYEPIWPKSIEEALGSIVSERNSALRLRQEGLEPIRAVLFQGPPGVGKTLACQWLARELELPLLTLDLATVMSSLLGKTGSNIKAVVDYAKSFPCVLLLDEFDSVAKRRDDERDVGELKRLVTVLLQAIDQWPSTSLLVAATNHPDLLDPAVWRRFELQVTFSNPQHDAIEAFLKAEGISSESALLLAAIFAGMSFADLRRSVLAAKKKAVLSGNEFASVLLNDAISHAERIGVDATEIRNAKIVQLDKDGLSQRKIAELLGVSHPTVGRVLKDSKGA
ncbi:MAG: ATPase AAA-superfamily [Comamonadaceae bacterium]|nr:MAG: ATPase AAA-superfamily [Comamonadaceae bacterium]